MRDDAPAEVRIGLLVEDAFYEQGPQNHAFISMGQVAAGQRYRAQVVVDGTTQVDYHPEQFRHIRQVPHHPKRVHRQPLLLDGHELVHPAGQLLELRQQCGLRGIPLLGPQGHRRHPPAQLHSERPAHVVPDRGHLHLGPL